MNWKEIKTSSDSTYFTFENAPLFEKKFIEVLKFHAPGLAPVEDDLGSYHIDVKGNPLYIERYTRTFGYYCNRATVVDGEKWFHIDEKGFRVYLQDYAWAGNYQEDLCTVRGYDNYYYHIKPDGVRAYPTSYLYAGDYKDGIACVKLKDESYRHINMEGNFTNNKSFLDLGVFHKSIATAKDDRGWFHINLQGCPLYMERYLNIEQFYNGFALVTKHDHTKIIINEQGKFVLSI